MYMKFLGIMMLIIIKRHLSNIWGSIYKTVKQHWGSSEKNFVYLKIFYYFQI